MKNFIKNLSLALVVAFVGVILCACVPSNIEKAQAKMEEAGYVVIALDKDFEEAEGLLGGLIATKGDIVNGYETISALLFEDKDTAKKFYEKWISSEESTDEDTIVKQDGKWVYAGTEKAIADFCD